MHWRRLARDAAVVGLVAASSAGLQGCDPCVGGGGCRATHIGVDGRLLVADTAAPVRGATITLIADYGGRRDSTATLTDASGLFSVRLPSEPSALNKLSLRVSSPGYPGYLVDSLACYPRAINGDACVL